ncbi:MAG: hypothetical protein COW71_09230 [Ignavibacteriales bacterium CG18_big_fil_WC_8_21_14_2_50_31_20]|nr:MAG: hypothetical protein COW71_09230 [Ignavibacteriales bacterium CG18_big_fil_WC_8_21_14_2_50_31_20]
MKSFSFLFILVIFVSIVNCQTNEEFRGVWITNVDSKVLETDEKIVEAMDYLASIGVNVVFPVVYNKGYTLYPSEVFESYFGVKTLPQPAFANRDFLERITIEAHRNGIEVIPWFEFGFSTSYSDNGGHIIKKYPSWALKNISGQLVTKNGFDWMSGIYPEVQEYMTSLLLEVIDKYDIDGVQGDDRLPAMPVEGGYEEYTVELYKSEHNGAAPPTSITNSDWKKWRADKLTYYLSDLRDSIKARNEDLILSCAPTPYYWGYNEYLQDSKTWAKNGLVDNIIPQLYQYNMTDYNYALDLITTQVRDENPDIFAAGILAKVGSYVIDTVLLGNMLQANRDKNVKGECLFFYEAFRANNGEVGQYLKTSFYSDSAAIPYRNGKIHRPKAQILNETDSKAIVTGNWSEYPMKGFDGKILRSNETSNYVSVEYNLSAPEDAFYDVFIYMVPNTPWSDSAHYQIYSDSLIFNGADSTSIYWNQSNTSVVGWQKIGTTYLNAGEKKVVKVDNKNLKQDKYIFTDAVMLMINRSIKKKTATYISKNENTKIPREFELLQNYPNPFNPCTVIEYRVSEKNNIKLFVTDLLGRDVKTLVNEVQAPSSYKVNFLSDNLASGIYFYTLLVGNQRLSKKMLLIK